MHITIRRTVCAHLAILVGCLTLPLKAYCQPNGPPVELVLQAARPLQVALDKRVTAHHGGQRVTGTLVQPVYVYDRIVLPAGARFSGHIDRLEPAPTRLRLIAMLGGDFSPHRRVVVTFDTVTIGDGAPISIETVVTGGGQRVTREVAADPARKDPGEEKTSAVGRMRQNAAEEAHAAIGVLKEPGKAERVKEAAINALPYHPEILGRGVVYDLRLLKPVSFGVVSPAPSAPPDSLPAPDTILTARLTTGVTSGTSPRGTSIGAVLTAPIFSDQHELILPEGTQLTGEVTYSTKARHMRHNGKIRVLFSSVQPPEQAPRPLLASLYAIRAGEAENLAVDEEGGASIANPKSRFIAPAVAALALAGAVHQEPEQPDPGETFSAGEMQGNPGAQSLGGFFGFGLVGAVIGQFSRPAGIVFSAVGLARSLYSTVFAKGREVSFAVDTPIQVRLAPRPAASK
jgi:hypothetical protein